MGGVSEGDLTLKTHVQIESKRRFGTGGLTYRGQQSPLYRPASNTDRRRARRHSDAHAHYSLF